MYTIIAYILYLLCSFLIVVWVGKILHTNGRAYLFEECPDKAISEAANNLLYVGYCLVNTGFAFYHLDTCGQMSGIADVVEFMADSEGFILITLSILHFINMFFAPKIISLFIKRNELAKSK
ncbi:MAG: hypothetical protein JST26_03710 [Bacteroidetes bacterium]|nr:hypothetical protein [Bacteroidota bacterium]